MNKLFFIGLILLAHTQLSHAQGMEFFEGSFEEALEVARQQDKAVFVDAYTTWCGPCKKMSKYVFTEKSVGDYYNANFVNLKINMEKPAGRKFKLDYPVSAYPTFYYIDPDGNVLYTTKGGRQPDQFIDLGKQALLKYDRTAEFLERYEAGERDFETMYGYIKALNKSGKPSSKIVNDYLLTQTDLTTPENLKIIFEGMTQFDSKIYDHFVTHKAKILEHVKAKDVEDKVKRVADQTVAKAIKFKESSLLTMAQEKRADHIKEDAKEFNLSSNMTYAAATKDEKMYVKNAKKFCKKYATDANSQNRMVQSAIKDFKGDNSVMKWANGLAEKAAKNGGRSEYYINLAYTQFFLKDNEGAMKSAEKALSIAQENKEKEGPARALIAKLKA